MNEARLNTNRAENNIHKKIPDNGEYSAEKGNKVTCWERLVGYFTGVQGKHSCRGEVKTETWQLGRAQPCLHKEGVCGRGTEQVRAEGPEWEYHVLDIVLWCIFKPAPHGPHILVDAADYKQTKINNVGL